MTLYDRFLEISAKVEKFMMDSLFGTIIGVLALCAALCVIIVGLAWIFGDKTDRGECLQSHAEPYVVYMYVNKVMIPSTQYRNVCDVWEYPAGVQ